jgi:protein-S-isoprenylcysteine O-methyltransferase Ste14
MRERPAAFRQRGTVWVVAQLLTLLAVLVLGPYGPGHDPRIPNGTIGRALLVISGVIALVGFLNLGRNLSPHPKPGPRTTLIQHGIYAWIRHPLYTSLMIGAFGWALLWQNASTLVAAIVLVMVLDAKARVEEHWLRQRFPTYPDYERRVRRFIPWIY